ncbi:MAG: type 2 isopentenyl-diphosphate Delta-isomerase [Candidatus Hermodarchaeota archaeon]|nr:type 2 isopentenyl-diphosphate Delta-isomerase [Candidatus Hermodarchaeota archaeon]
MVTTRMKSDTKKKGTRTEDRKQEHIRICLDREIESNTPAGFNDITLIHNAVPEINLDDVNLQCTFLGHKLQAPIMVTAMTGGHEEALPINHHIAQAVEALGLAMGVGSQRAAIEDSTLAPSFSVTRENAPTAFIIGNIGAPQLSLGYDVKEAEIAIKMLEANALAIHFNAAQEAIQPEGEAHFSGVLQALRRLTKSLSTPIIAKETGAGINPDNAEQLAKAGVKAIDVAGLGGTSWPAVEVERAKTEDALKATLGRWFTDWGIPTAVATFEVTQKNLSIPVIASGGIRTGVDIAKSIALGATVGGVALPVLSPAMLNAKAVQVYLASLIQGLKATMFLVGAKTLEDLTKTPLIIQGATRNWLELRGHNLEELAMRSIR